MPRRCCELVSTAGRGEAHECLTDRVHTFGHAMRERHGPHLHKVALDAGFTCPNAPGERMADGIKSKENMMPKHFTAAVLATLIATLSPGVVAEHPSEAGGLHLSPPLRALLQEEMREITRGTQALVVAMASADWRATADIAGKIHASYILHRKLSPGQRQEFGRALPDGFKQRDAEFHSRAQKLANAARARDHELAAFHFGRMIEACSGCHADYARSRFPGFSPGRSIGHDH